MNITENYIGYDALDLDKWQNFDITWYNRFLNAAKNLFEPDIFVAVKDKIKTEHLQHIKELQIFWQEIIKEFDKKKKNLPETSQSNLPKKKQVIKECDKKNLTLAEISQPATSLPKRIGKDSIKNLSESSEFFQNFYIGQPTELQIINREAPIC
ncbi:unnamed protein product [Rhizophagus irregularis]|uniref:Uncharacterized protein n=1 Tax=Rhizophagus irregularis TaxID=588596 RepID=A0A915ZVB7_9GLOM|nr:unnamed protein product [Rhizophagus irregularis]CAB5388771.1 unnamed protein product [Rhizophagus irregularis]